MLDTLRNSHRNLSAFFQTADNARKISSDGLNKDDIVAVRKLAELISAQGGNIDPFRIIVPQMKFDVLYMIAQYLFGVDPCYGRPPDFIDCSKRRNAEKGSYIYTVASLPFEKEMDITIEERLVFEILYFLKYGNRPEGADSYCTSSPVSGTLWWPYIPSPQSKMPFCVRYYCYWS